LRQEIGSAVNAASQLLVKLAAENILEIEFPGNYFEYVHVIYEDNIASAMSMFYSNMRVSSVELSQNLQIGSDSANLIAYQFPDTENQIAPEALITGYLNGDIQDCVILSCLPFSIELENQSTGRWKTIVDQFAAIPLETPVFIEKATDRLACKFRSQNMEIIKVSSLAEPIENMELRFLIDAGYVKYFELLPERKLYL
jgi:hypothetical protein